MSMLDQALKRPLDFASLSPREQWEIDKRLGILDWNPTADEAQEFDRRWRDMQQTRVTTLLEQNKEKVERLIAVGLPGCYAIGFVPGPRPGTLKPGDVNHKVLVEALLRYLPEVPRQHPSDP